MPKEISRIRQQIARAQAKWDELRADEAKLTTAGHQQLGYYKGKIAGREDALDGLYEM